MNMILVTLGTFPLAFERPLNELHKICSENKINEPIVVQSGYTKHSSKYFEMIPFIPSDELDGLTRKANLIISHAGTGSLIKALKLNKKVIAIPRLAKHKEVVDNHQLEILKVFAEKKYVLPWWKDNTLEDLLEEAKVFTPQPYISKKQIVIDYLEKYINSL